MEAAVVQYVSPTATGTASYTAGITITALKGVIFSSSASNQSDTAVAAAKINFGATDLTNNIASSSAVTDGSASPNTRGLTSIVNCIEFINSSGTVRGAAAYAATLGNGLAVNWTSAPASGAELLTALMLGGADIAISTPSQGFGTGFGGSGNKTVTHGNGGIPEIIIPFLCGSAAFDSAVVNSLQGLGVWTSGASWGIGLGQQTATAPTNVGAQIDSSDSGKMVNGTPAISGILTISSVGATTFVANISGGANAVVGFICIRGVGTSLLVKTGLATTPTSPTTQALTGAGGKPKVLMTFPTRLTGTSFVTDDTAGAWGIGMACDNAGVTQQFAAAASSRDNVNPSVAKSYASTRALLVLDNTFNADIEATVSSWDADGVTLSYSNVSASAQEFGYLMFGVPVAITAPSPNVGALSIAGLGPTLGLERTMTPLVGSAVIAGLAPMTSAALLAPTVGALSVGGQVPTVVRSTGPQANPAISALSMLGLVPSLLKEKIITPDVANFADDLNDLTPTILTEWAAKPSVGLAIIGGLAPFLIRDSTAFLAPSVGLVTLGGLVPDVQQGSNPLSQPGRGQVDLIGLAPTIQVTVPLAPDVGALTLSGFAPTIRTKLAWRTSPAESARVWRDST